MITPHQTHLIEAIALTVVAILLWLTVFRDGDDGPDA